MTNRGSGKINKIKVRVRDYKTIALFKDGKHHYFYIHQLVARAYIPNPNGYKMINHKDGNKTNNTVENLEWCTHKQNMEHAYVNGFTTRGTSNTQTKLTEEQVRAIRKEYNPPKISSTVLGRKYGVSGAAVLLVVRRKNWAWVV